MHEGKVNFQLNIAIIQGEFLITPADMYRCGAIG